MLVRITRRFKLGGIFEASDMRFGQGKGSVEWRYSPSILFFRIVHINFIREHMPIKNKKD